MSPRVALQLLVAATSLSLAGPAPAQVGDWDDGTSGGAPGGYDVQVDVEPTAITLETFQSGLSPYGEWVQSGVYGPAWRPRVSTGWRPYYFGRWEWTNEGWLWVSEEPFGWATYHYGRWALDRGQGWLWVPGYQWAPAWVSWRFGGDVVGWAPLAPGLSLYVTNYAFLDFWWTFVPSARFCGTPVWGVAHSPSRAYQFYGVTTPAPPRSRPPPMGSADRGGTRPPAGRALPAWGGPPPRYIEERTGRAVSTSRIVDEPRPGAGRGRTGEIGVYRPELAPRQGSAARPAPMERSAPGSQRWRGEGERRASPSPRQLSPPTAPAPRQLAPPAAPAAPRPEGRPVPVPRGNAPPPGNATPRGGGASRGEAPSPGRGAQPRRDGWRDR